MDVKSDGVDCFILPDGAKCKLTGHNPLDMEECPCLHECCDGNCVYYTEEDK